MRSATALTRAIHIVLDCLSTEKPLDIKVIGWEVFVVSEPVWPLMSLRLEVGEVTLVVPDDVMLTELAVLASRGIHPSAEMPFSTPWTLGDPSEVAQRYLQWQWGTRAKWRASSWILPFAVLERGRLVGSKSLHAQDFATRREVGTGSWVAAPDQGRGIGMLMRTAVLSLAFAGLGATWAVSESLDDNFASQRVNERLGYQPDGIQVVNRLGVPTVLRRYRMHREEWMAQVLPEVKIVNLDRCSSMFTTLSS